MNSSNNSFYVLIGPDGVQVRQGLLTKCDNPLVRLSGSPTWLNKCRTAWKVSIASNRVEVVLIKNNLGLAIAEALIALLAALESPPAKLVVVNHLKKGPR